MKMQFEIEVLSIINEYNKLIKTHMGIENKDLLTFLAYIQDDKSTVESTFTIDYYSKILQEKYEDNATFTFEFISNSLVKIHDFNNFELTCDFQTAMAHYQSFVTRTITNYYRFLAAEELANEEAYYEVG